MQSLLCGLFQNCSADNIIHNSVEVLRLILLFGWFSFDRIGDRFWFYLK
jgi:hypothetical protein